MELKLQQAAAVGIDADFYAHGVIGQNVFYQFGPLQETEVAAVEVVFVAHVIDFLDAADAVEVKVVDGGAMPVGVFIDEGEGGRGDDVVYAQFLAQCLDEGGLAGAHAAIECDDAGFADAVDKLLCRCAYGVERLYSDLCHIVLSFLGFQCDEGDEHLFHRDAAVLERVLVIRHGTSFGEIQKHLEAEGFEVTGAEFTYIPNNLKDVTPEERETIDKMVEKLEEFDDVQTVYTNMKPEIPADAE